MSVELRAPAALAAPAPAALPIVRGAELVHLARVLQVRLFALLAAGLLAASLVAVALAVLTMGTMDDVTLVAAAGGTALALAGLWRPAGTCRWLAAARWRSVALTALIAVALLANGVDGPAWWVALGLLLLQSVAVDARTAVLSSVVVTAAFVAGALLAGGSLARHGADAGVLAGAFGLLAYPWMAGRVASGFVRLVLSLHRAQLPPDEPAGPLVVLNLAARPASPHPATASRPPRQADRPVIPPAADPPRPAAADPDVARRAAPAQAAADPGAATHAAPQAAAVPHAPLAGGASARAGDRLTPRQLEVALLAADGLRAAEVAAALGISVVQVERHLRGARERLGAATTGVVVAALVGDGLVPPLTPR